MPRKKNPKLIIDSEKALRQINRIAYQILEENYQAKELIILGIANRGYKLAQLIVKQLKKYGDIPIHLSSITLNKKDPTKQSIVIADQKLTFSGKTIIIIDDVGNTGRTLFYAMLPLADDLPKKIQAAVLVDRMHKLYPIKVDFVGMPLATTIQEEVIVEFDDKGKIEGAYLH